jgi:hypothetical protein
MMRKRKDKLPEYAVSDAAAAYIADALMQLALQFEAKHFAQIRRHYQSIVTEPDDGPSQLDLFGEHPSSKVASECEPNRRNAPPRIRR